MKIKKSCQYTYFKFFLFLIVIYCYEINKLWRVENCCKNNLRKLFLYFYVVFGKHVGFTEFILPYLIKSNTNAKCSLV